MFLHRTCLWLLHLNKSFRILLKSIRDKFNFLVYFKLITFKISKQVESLCSSDSIACIEGDEVSPKYCSSHTNFVENEMLRISGNSSFYRKYLERGSVSFSIDRKVLGLHVEAAFQTLCLGVKNVTVRYTDVNIKNIISLLKTTDLHDHEIPKWKCIINIRSDLKLLYSTVFDLCLEQIWTKLRFCNSMKYILFLFQRFKDGNIAFRSVFDTPWSTYW